MSIARRNRRREEDGSLVCENGHLRLRVTREGRSLALRVETRGLDMEWGSLGLCSGGDDILYRSADGEEHTGFFFAFDPVEVDGATNGVALHGHLGNTSLTFTALLDPASTWCTVRLVVAGAPISPCLELQQQWRLLPGDTPPELCWPPTTLRGEALAFTPAAFVQDGPVFAALVARLEDEQPDDYELSLAVADAVQFTYGIFHEEGLAVTPSTPMRVSCALCLDARALPERGFQQVVRILGSDEDLAMVGRCPARPSAAPLPELPPAPSPEDWFPFVWEGTPATIAACVRQCLQRAAQDDLQALETGLCWLDRLCLQQRTFGPPYESPIGAFGPGEEWPAAACWMPVLLMQAFRLTGIPEYAYRAQAALHALPPDLQAAALGQLRPAFGDVYVHADCQEIISLCGPDVTGALFTADGLQLAVTPADGASAMRLVLDGSDAAYALAVNGVALGTFATGVLRDGLDFALPG